MFRVLTAGESHGPQLTAIIEGLPSGLRIDIDSINNDLARRQGGYGRGGRMQIENDKAEILSGLRWGETLGSPLTLSIKNRDWPNWKEKMSPFAEFKDDSIKVTHPRPGHADLSGVLKYDHRDVRNVLERSSARETAIRVAVGSCAKCFLKEFGIGVYGIVSEIDGIQAVKPEGVGVEELYSAACESDLYTYDKDAEKRMKENIDIARENGDSVGGVVEINVCGVPIGLGSYVQWDRKLDARLAMALMSIQAMKGVEIGIGFDASRRKGSAVHDEIYFDKARLKQDKNAGFFRKTNNAGGIEGGMSNGETIIVRGAMKPIPTLYKPLKSVDIVSKDPYEATVERSDVCAVPAAAVVAEAVIAIEIANAFQEKFGGDSIRETKRNYLGYVEYLKDY